MTQNPDKAVEWLVKVPEGSTDTFNARLTKACRGNEKIGLVANRLLYDAAWKAKNAGIDITQVDSITLDTVHLNDLIKKIQDVLRHTIGKTALISYIAKLEEWGFIQADGYRHTYTVYFKKIQDAFNTPPEKEPAKPRGKRTRKKDFIFEDFTSKMKSEISSTMPEDFSFANFIKTEIRAQVEAELQRISLLEKPKQEPIEDVRISDLIREISIMKSRISDLNEWISIAKSALSDETACRAALEADLKTLYKILDSNTRYRENVANATPPHTFFAEQDEQFDLLEDDTLQSDTHSQCEKVTQQIAEQEVLQPEQSSAAPPAVAPSEKPKRVRASKDAATMIKRVEAVYTCIERVSVKLNPALGDGYKIPRASKRSETHQAIVSIINADATPEAVSRVYLDMWNEQDPRTKAYWWREPGHLTIKALCTAFASRWTSIKFKMAQEARLAQEAANRKAPADLTGIDPSRIVGGIVLPAGVITNVVPPVQFISKQDRKELERRRILDEKREEARKSKEG